MAPFEYIKFVDRTTTYHQPRFGHNATYYLHSQWQDQRLRPLDPLMWAQSIAGYSASPSLPSQWHGYGIDVLDQLIWAWHSRSSVWDETSRYLRSQWYGYPIQYTQCADMSRIFSIYHRRWYKSLLTCALSGTVTDLNVTESADMGIVLSVYSQRQCK
jgi:hypothetical protein